MGRGCFKIRFGGVGDPFLAHGARGCWAGGWLLVAFGSVIELRPASQDQEVWRGPTFPVASLAPAEVRRAVSKH